MRYRERAWLVALLLCASVCHAGKPGEQTEPFRELYSGPWLQRVTSSSAIVVWRTTGSITPAVRYGTRPDRLDGVVPSEAIRTDANSYLKWQFPPGRYPTLLMLRAAFQTPKISGVATGVYHYEARLSTEQMRRVKCWIDLNCPLWPDYQFRPNRPKTRPKPAVSAVRD